jgi:photosystem II stability/assembly factor-like uncharacterized protein
MGTSTFIATTGNGLTRAVLGDDGTWSTESLLAGTRVLSLARDENTVYAGTEHGVLRSDDRGQRWQVAGLQDHIVRSLATTRSQPGKVLAGTRPAMLFASDDRGQTWQELEGFRAARRWWWFTPADPPFNQAYVLGLTVSPTDPDRIVAGLEFGALLRSDDGGMSWSKHLKGADRDCHTVTFNALDGRWIYQGGGGSAALSSDGGITWKGFKPAHPLAAILEGFGKPILHHGLDRHYGWAAAGDPHQPQIWYFSASFSPMRAHGSSGQAEAHLFRCTDGETFEKLSGGLPDPLPHMPYALITDVEHTGHLYAGLSNGDIWQTRDYGDSWVRLDVNVGGIHRQMIGF